MTHKVLILPEAASEAEAAYVYIAKQSPEKAVAWYNGLLDAMFSLDTLPKRHPVAPESEFLDREVRQFVHGNYRIIYLVEDQPKVVRILYVRHGARRRFGEQGE